MPGGADVGVQGEEKWIKDAALRGTADDGPQLHLLTPVRQDVCDPPVDGVRFSQLGELVLQENWDDEQDTNGTNIPCEP